MEPNQILFLISLVKGVLLFMAFLFSSVGVYALFRPQGADSQFRGIIFAMSLVLGPLALAWCLGMLLYFTPGKTRNYYLIVSILPFALPAILKSKQIGLDIIMFFRKWWTYFNGHPVQRALALILLLLLLVVLGALVVINTTTPMHGNDALEYSKLAQVISEHKTNKIYPLMDPNIADGFSAGWTHPMGYINLLVYSYLLQGPTDYSGISRYVAPYFAFAIVWIINAFAGYKSKIVGLLSAFLTLTTPLFYSLVVQNHIDATRISAFVAAIIAIWMVSRRPTNKFIILAGLACGMSMYSHSIGILTLPLAIPIYIITAKPAKLKRHIFVVISICVLAFLPLIFRYVINLNVFGSMIADSVEMWTFPELNIDKTRTVERYMATPIDLVLNGAFAGFTKIKLFGFAYYLLSVILVVMALRNLRSIGKLVGWLKSQSWRQSDDPIYTSALVLLGYLGIMLLTISMGTDLAVKNPRYILTIQPFIIILSMLMVAKFWKVAAVKDEKVGA